MVVDGSKILNKDGLRNSKEFVYHKILDCLGDFLLSGHRVIGWSYKTQGGHGFTYKLLKKLFSTALSH